MRELLDFERRLCELEAEALARAAARQRAGERSELFAVDALVIWTSDRRATA
ncbi:MULTISPECIES: hypothetical protein [unclassified Conexibacter]|uniref:hypothetical protein n=1 Tax=unclassified Conexibacter TaxID=2627773 RepID=UPI00271ACAC0|nr:MULTISPECIES: hypothetical protein [unclassified Conexibacter]MDO8189027.1 hypothetical protein [Conexibacter sp. CPCC 205706]MDO8198532.1 hypothetical protein [Conexibacter sp. CPCC 205762]